MPKLLIVAGDGSRREVELSTGNLRLGRAPENDIALPDPTKGVSRMHAELRYENGRYVILDLNSQNGTWVDETRIERADLASGSEIAIGPYHLALIGDGLGPAVSSAEVSSDTQSPVEPEMPPLDAMPDEPPPTPVTLSPEVSQIDDAPEPESITPFDSPHPSLAPDGPFNLAETPALAENRLEVASDAPIEESDAAIKEKEAESTSEKSEPAPKIPVAAPPERKPAAALPKDSPSTPVLAYGKPAASSSAVKSPAAAAPPAVEKPEATAAPPKPAPRRPVRPMPPRVQPPAARSSNAALFGGVFVVALLLGGAGWYFYWPSAPAPRSAPATPPPSDPNQISSVAEIIVRDLVDGKALIEKKEYQAAIRDHFDRILLLDPKHAEAIALKAKAQEALELQQQEAANAAAAAAAPARGRATGTPPPTTKPATPSAGTTPPGRSATPPAAAPTTRGGARGAQSLPSPRRPNETEQAWRTRNAALQTQYDGAKNAFNRRQFAAAISGFEAVVKSEPKYLDAAQLLARARADVKVTGKDAFEAGNKFDAAGRWSQALEQYDRARQLDPSLRSQVDEATRRVLAKMRGAGGDAFKRARQYDALGRAADALKEYENAAQWLPSDDANRAVARQRADQLKAGLK